MNAEPLRVHMNHLDRNWENRLAHCGDEGTEKMQGLGEVGRQCAKRPEEE